MCDQSRGWPYLLALSLRRRNDPLAVAQRLPSNSDGLATIVIPNAKYLSNRLAFVADLEGTRGVEDFEAVRQKDQLQQITIDGIGKDSLHDRL